MDFDGLEIRKANGSKSRKDAELLNYSDLISLKQSNQSGNIGPSPRAGRRLKQSTLAWFQACALRAVTASPQRTAFASAPCCQRAYPGPGPAEEDTLIRRPRRYCRGHGLSDVRPITWCGRIARQGTKQRDLVTAVSEL